jgi:hypothetical protein
MSLCARAELHGALVTGLYLLGSLVKGCGRHVVLLKDRCKALPADRRVGTKYVLPLCQQGEGVRCFVAM